MAEGMHEPARDATAAGGAQELVARARALGPVIEAAAAATERNGALSQALLDALHGARLFRMLLPRSAGGLEVEPATFVEVLEALAQADGSTAWVVAQGCGCTHSAAYMVPETAREIFAPANAVLAWGPSGTGARAVAVDGGFRVTGRWHFASGNRHAQWIGAHCTVHEGDGSVRLDASGRPLERTLIVPRSDASVEGNWDVIGLAGTGSDSYSITDVFVPAARSYRREAPEERHEPGPLYNFTGMHIFAFGIAAMALGLSRALLDALVGVAREKIERSTGRPMKESGVTQAEVAKAEAKLAASRLLLLTTARELYASAAAGNTLSLDQRARMRLSTTWAVAEAKEVADFSYTAAGANAIFAAGQFERRFRDIHTLTQQVQAHAGNFEAVGQVLLGVPSTSRLL